jgi:hypothetical protein
MIGMSNYHKHVMYTQRYINVMNVSDEGVYHKHVMYTKGYINVMNVSDEGVYHKQRHVHYKRYQRFHC